MHQKCGGVWNGIRLPLFPIIYQILVRTIQPQRLSSSHQRLSCIEQRLNCLHQWASCSYILTVKSFHWNDLAVPSQRITILYLVDKRQDLSDKILLN